jgi:hypothetical protein
MSKKFLTPIAPPALSSDPAAGVVGALYYNTALNALRYYNGTIWTTIGAANAGEAASSIQALPTAPSNPAIGAVYFDTQERTIKTYNGIVWYDVAGPKEILKHTHTGSGDVDAVQFGEYVEEDLVFANNGTSNSPFIVDFIDGGNANGN